MESLRDWLCLEWGFCGEDGPAQLSGRSSWTAEEFALEVLRAEGIRGLETDWSRKIRDEFIRRYGKALSPAYFEHGPEQQLARLGGSDPKAKAPRRRRPG